MAEIVVGLAQAAKVLYFVELGREILNCVENASQPNGEIIAVSPTVTAVIDRLSLVLEQLESAFATALRENAIGPETGGIYKTTQTCVQLAGQLRRFSKEVEAYDSVNVDILKNELEELQQDLVNTLLAFINLYGHLSLTKQNNFITQLIEFADPEGHQRLEVESSGWPYGEGFGFKLIECLAPIEAPGDTTMQLFGLQIDLINAIYANAKIHGEVVTLPVVRDGRKFHLIKRFLDMQQYREPKDSEVQVPEAHRIAFSLILKRPRMIKRPWIDFYQWLESDQPLYWITGEYQTGKSTLMKFITHRSNGLNGNQVQCTPFLRNNTTAKPVIIGKFYFNAPGTCLAISKEGMLRSLLFQILIKCPDVVSVISPIHWRALCLFDDAWVKFTQQDLQELLFSTLKALSESRQICLFLDGLDELDNPDRDLACFLKKVITTTKTKICFVSRSSPIYEKIFECQPHLEMHHLTHDYLTSYVTEKLETSDVFLEIRLRDPDFTNQLVNGIVTKAAGNFLWARVTTHLILLGLHNGDDSSMLTQILDGLPSRTEDLYRDILNRLAEPDLKEVARLFLLMESSAQPPSAMLLSFTMEDNPRFAIELSTEFLPPESVDAGIEALCDRVMVQCKGLIEFDKGERAAEASWLDGPVARYLDETVKSFIIRPDVQNDLCRAAGSDFDPHLQLCAAYVALHKLCESKTKELLRYYKSTPTFADKALLLCMRHASRVEPQHISDMVDLLDQIKISGTPSRCPWWQVEGCIPAFLCEMEGLKEFQVGGEMCGPSLLSLAVKCGVSEYVKARMPTKGLVPLDDVYPPNHPHHPWPLLLDAMENSFPNAEVVSALLKGGADPNGTTGKTKTGLPTVWGSLLSHVLCVFAKGNVDAGRAEKYTEIVCFMVQHGASLETSDLEAAVEREHLRVSMMESQMKDLARVLKRDFEQIKVNPKAPLDLTTIIPRAREESEGRHGGH